MPEEANPESQLLVPRAPRAGALNPWVPPDSVLQERPSSPGQLLRLSLLVLGISAVFSASTGVSVGQVAAWFRVLFSAVLPESLWLLGAIVGSLLLLIPSFFFGCLIGGAIVLLKDLWHGPRRFRLSPEGFEDTMLGVGLIPWEDLEGVEHGSIYSQHLLLDLRDPEKYLSRKGAQTSRSIYFLHRWAGESPFLVNLLGTRIDASRLREELLTQASQAKARKKLPAGANKKPGDPQAGESQSQEEPPTTADWISG